jgi:hypothetical protein
VEVSGAIEDNERIKTGCGAEKVSEHIGDVEQRCLFRISHGQIGADTQQRL